MQILQRSIWVICLLIATQTLWADVVVLRQGKTLQGEVLVQNDEVVIIKNQDGNRYQYPASEVLSIQKDDSVQNSTQQSLSSTPTTYKKAALLAEISGVGAFLRDAAGAGGITADLGVGSHTIGTRRIVLGGSIGYHAYWVNASDYQYIPLQFVMRMPLIQSKNAPLVGASIGYAFCVSKNANSGPCASVDIGWWHCINEQSSLTLSAHIGWQQTSMKITETIDSQLYTHYAGSNIFAPGIQLSMQF